MLRIGSTSSYAGDLLSGGDLERGLDCDYSGEKLLLCTLLGCIKISIWQPSAK